MIELIALTEEQIKQASRLSEVRDSSDSDQNGSSEEEHENEMSLRNVNNKMT